PARAGVVLEHPRLGVAEALHLEQGRGPPALVARAGSAQHQALAPQRLQAIQLATEVVEALATLVVMRHRVGRAVASETLAHEGEALLKLLIQLGGVEDDVADLLPVLALVLGADDADGAL